VSAFVVYAGSGLSTIDAKGRVTIPAELRDTVAESSGENVVCISRHPNLPCLIGYGRAVAWEMPIMGADFTLWRIVISLPMPILAGALGRFVYVRVRHRIKL
jgi:hypothetical protein